MIKKNIIFALVFVSIVCSAQQYPMWTQYRSIPTLLNPGFCGTKRLVDARLSYRNQWNGFDGSPKTYALSLNSRLSNGKLGIGGFIFKDDIGPFKTFNSSITAAYHLKFDDSELSIGIQGNYMKQRFNGIDITIRNQQDRAINQYIEDKAGNFDGSFGVVYYNDRFHLGIGANNVTSSSLEYYKDDTIKKGKYVNTPHYNLSAGFNWADNTDFVFENSALAIFVSGMPITFDYTVRLHIKKQLMSGLSIRFGDAIALQLGYTIQDAIQITYSYDFLTSPLKKYQNGTHEIKLIFSSNLGKDIKKRGLNGRFLKQKFQYIL